MNSKKRTIIAFLLIGTLSFSVLGSLAVSSEELEDGNTNTQIVYNTEGETGNLSENELGKPGPDEQEGTTDPQPRYRYQEQEMTIEGQETSTRIRSRLGENTSEEIVDFFFSIDGAPTFQLSFSSQQTGYVFEQHFRLVVEQLIEYVDINGNGRYDTNDVVVSAIEFSNTTFTNITYTSTITPEGGRITIIRTDTLDQLFTIIIYVSDKKTSFMNTTIAPTEIKFDFGILGYPFMNQSSQLALQTLLETPFMITTQQRTYASEEYTNAKESTMNISSAGRFGFFSWINDAIVDTVSKPVNVTVISNTEQTFYEGGQSSFTQAQVIFSYARGQSILHDPKIGVIPVLGTILPSVLQMEYLSVLYLIAIVISGIVFYGVVHYRKKA